MDYHGKTILELRTLCKQHGIKGITGKKKNDLIEMLKASDPAQSSLSKNEPAIQEMTTPAGSLSISADFEACEKLYNQNKDLNTLYNDPNGLKYLMIRSFGKDDLVEISKEKNKKIHIDTLRMNVFITTDIETIIGYTVHNKRPLAEDYVRGLSRELSKICVESSSVHQDDFNSNMNRIIRNVDVCTYKKLQEELETTLVRQLKNYMTWQWYNQKCSDLIENLILTQSNIIQTPRKIKNIDFFVRIDETCIFPFDLKLTIFPAGFMKENKIPNERKAIETYISEVSNQHKILRWLYTEQNPRLFSNNYRHFVILLDLENTDHSYKLKCNIGLINESIQKFFSTIQKTDIIDITYEYKKDKAKSGIYHTKCTYTLITS